VHFLITGGLIVSAPLFYGMWREQYALTNYGPAAAEIWGLRWYALSIAAIFLFILFLIFRIRYSQRAVIIFKNGIGIQNPHKKKTALRWVEISGITSETIETRFLGTVSRNLHRLTIHPSIGKMIQIHRSIPDQDELASRIKARLYPVLLPEFRNTLEHGGNLYFGQVVLNNQEIQLWGNKIPWEQIAVLNVREGFLVVELKNQMVRKIPIRQIPNVELLLQIIQEGVEL